MGGSKSQRLDTNRGSWAHEALHALSAGIIVFRQSGEVVFANPRAGDLLHRSHESFLDHDVGALLTAVDHLTREDERVEFDVDLPSGQTITVGASVTPLTSADAYVCMFQDITDVRRLKLERDRLVQLGAITSVLPAMLHELRNPVAAISTTLELLVEEAEDGIRDDLHALLTEIRRVNLNLQGVGSVGRDLMSSTFAPVDEALHNLIRVMEGKAQRHKVSLFDEVETLPLLPFDTGVLQAIAFNIVDNAIAASPVGGLVRISASLDPDDSFRLCVVDTGKGMSQDVVNNASRLFFTTKPRGSGIGLALVERCVKGAGGRLTFDSTPGEGTHVTILIPNATTPPATLSRD